jgi:hypothetical protein
MSVPTTSISPLLTSIRESASLSRRFSAATKTRGLAPAAVLSFARAALSSAAMLVRLSHGLLCYMQNLARTCIHSGMSSMSLSSHACTDRRDR